MTTYKEDISNPVVIFDCAPLLRLCCAPSAVYLLKFGGKWSVHWGNAIMNSFDEVIIQPHGTTEQFLLFVVHSLEEFVSTYHVNIQS